VIYNTSHAICLEKRGKGCVLLWTTEKERGDRFFALCRELGDLAH